MYDATSLPVNGFVRLKQISGDRHPNPPIPAVTPVSRSRWWEGVRTGRHPPPIKLGPNTTAWRVQDIRTLIERLAAKPMV